MPAGTYVIEARSLHLVSATAGSACSWRFSDGTNTTTGHELNYSVSNSIGIPTVMGYLHYDTDQSAKTISLHAAASSGTPTCYTFSDAYRPFEITVRHYPSAQNSFRTTCSGLECENDFTAEVAVTSGAVSDESTDWLNGNCVRSGTNNYISTCAVNSGVFNQTPNCSGSSLSGGVDLSYIKGSSSSASLVFNSVNHDGTGNAAGFVVKCHRAGSDYNQFDQRFVPVDDGQDISVTGASNGGTSITASVTNIDFTEVTDNKNTWNGSQFTVPSGESGYYHVSGNVQYTTTLNSAHYFYVDGSVKNLIGYMNGATTLHKFDGIIFLNAGEVLSIRGDQSGTLATGTGAHWIAIKKLKGAQKAFIGNLTPTEFVQTPGSVKPVTYSAEVGTTGTVSKEVGDFINGNCTGVSPRTCTFETGAFASAPNCTVSAFSTGPRFATIESVSTTTIVVQAYTDTGADNNNIFSLVCHGVQ